MWYQNMHSASFSFVTIHASDRQTDRWTDRIATPCIALHGGMVKIENVTINASLPVATAHG